VAEASGTARMAAAGARRGHGGGVSACFLLAALLAMIVGCGLKGPPVPPMLASLPVPTDLAYTLTNGELVLTWRLDPGNGAELEGVAGVNVYRSQNALDEAPCEACTPLFEKLRAVEGRTTTALRETLTPGFRYRYKLRTFDAAGRESADSPVVTIAYE